MVPSLLPERIIGVTDPEDDTLVIWGIVREGEPPKQVRLGDACDLNVMEPT